MDQEKKHIVEMLCAFDTGVLVTRATDGSLHGRPMQVAKVEETGSVYFSASLHSPKIAEIKADSTVGLFFQEPKQWVSLSGTAEVHQDRHLIEDLWQESWKVWFPEGKHSADICLIQVVPHTAEYWDIRGQKGMRFVFEAMKAYVKGEKMDHASGGDHAKIAM